MAESEHMGKKGLPSDQILVVRFHSMRLYRAFPFQARATTGDEEPMDAVFGYTGTIQG